MNMHTSSWKDVMSALEDNWAPLTVIQGLAGCGKSTLLQHLWDSNPDHTLCVAPTGIAAQNIRDKGCPATTLHSAFRLKPVGLPIFKPADYTRCNELLQAVDVVIVDEMSMVNVSVMEWLLSLVDAAANAGHPVKLLLLGDVCQLPPVVNVQPELKDIWTRLFGSGTFFFNCPSFDRFNPIVYFMDKPFRQTDDVFSKALHALRQGPAPVESLDVLNSRICSREEFANACGSPFLTVVAKNSEKNEINMREQARLEAAGAESICYRTESNGVPVTSDVGRIPCEMRIHRGAQVMCICNSDEYQNGTVGIVEGFSDANLPLVRTSDGRLVEVGMHTYSDLVPVVSDDGELSYKEEGTISFIGCQSAYAVTVHKVQGLTLDKLYIQLGDWIPDSGLYVALSRCRRLEDIGLSRAITPADITCSAEALSFFSRYSGVA